MIDHNTLRQAYLAEIAHRLRTEAGDQIVRRALAVVAKWEASASVHRRYIATWREILAEGADAVLAVAKRGQRGSPRFAALHAVRRHSQQPRTAGPTCQTLTAPVTPLP